MIAMSGTSTVSGSTVPNNFSGASGATAAFQSYFNSSTSFTVFSSSGVSTVNGPAVLASPNTAVTLTGATAIADTSSGGNAITTTSNTTVFAAPNDTVTASTGATSLFGASSGQTNFSLGGSGSSVTGGAGSIVGTVSGANSTLVGGSGTSLFTVTGSNALAVAGSGGTTGINLSQTTGAETIATNPNGGSGKLVAVLGSGADSVIGGGGASTITAGSGADVFGFVKGHAGGSEVIIGYNSNDTLAFGGYGYSATNVPTENVGSVGDVITLSDGTTITLVGVDHKIFS
jgi:Ca2+-binding RTX toxin-like protein